MNNIQSVMVLWGCSQGVVLLFILLLAGCQTTQATHSQSSQPDKTVKPANLPDVKLTESLLSQVLAAEIAARYGQYELAIDKFLGAAHQSFDPRLAAKAAYWGLKSENYDKAIIATQYWLKLLEGQPQQDLIQARLALARSLLELNQHDEALKIYIQIIKGSEDNDVYKQIAGEISRLNNTKGMTDLYQHLVDSAEDKQRSLVGLAILAARLNDFELSRQAVNLALKENPANEDAALIKLDYLIENQDHDSVVTFADGFLVRNSGADKLRMEYALYLSTQGKTEKAIKHLEKVARNDKSQYEEATLGIIALAIQLKKYKLADKKLIRLLEDNPVDKRLGYFRCQVQRQLENYLLATKLCSEINLGQYYFPAQLEIAKVLADQGEVDSALTYLDNVPVSSSEEKIRIYINQQEILYEADEFERALAVLNTAIDKYKDNTSLLYTRGLILSELGRVLEHERDMRRLIKLDPENAQAYNALGYTLADLTTRYDESLELIRKAIYLRPGDAYILDSLGWVYFKLNQLYKSKIHLEKAFDLSGDAEIAAHLGELYWRLGEKSRAKAILRKAKKQAPDNKVLNKTIERLL